jgi:hypothetical protein
MSNRKYYSSRDGTEPTFTFTTDGCSGGMSAFWQHLVKPFTKTDIPWRDCCVTHDKDYWMGGTWKDRQNADQALRECVSARGYPITGFLMYWGVRAGGSPLWVFSWRWGYGWEKGLIHRITGWK